MNEDEQEIVDRKSAVVDRILHTDAPIVAEQGKLRAKRSDAGTKRPPKPQSEGKLTRDQAAHLGKLYGLVSGARLELDDCQTKLLKAAEDHGKAEADYFNYLSSITAK